jgi:serine/threonine-protein kinase
LHFAREVVHFDGSLTGVVIAGRYRLEEQIALGGMGIIFAARHVELDHRVAIKILRPDLARDAEASARFLEEARAAAGLKSARIVRVLDFGRLDVSCGQPEMAAGTPYMVLEYLEGFDLWTHVDRHGPLPVLDAVDHVVQVCEALAEVHAAGIVHRDLKPENLFVTETPHGEPIVKLLDFGISRRVQGAAALRLTSPGSGVGSPLYMSPEQMSTPIEVDARADIWSLGIVLFELLTARVPFDGETLPEVCNKVLNDHPVPIGVLRADVPAGLEAAILRCLRKNRSRRFDDVAELAKALAPYGSSIAEDCAYRAARTLRGTSSSPPPRLSRDRTTMPGLSRTFSLALRRRPLTAAALFALSAGIGLSPVLLSPNALLSPAQLLREYGVVSHPAGNATNGGRALSLDEVPVPVSEPVVEPPIVARVSKRARRSAPPVADPGVSDAAATQPTSALPAEIADAGVPATD